MNWVKAASAAWAGQASTEVRSASPDARARAFEQIDRVTRLLDRAAVQCARSERPFGPADWTCWRIGFPDCRYDASSREYRRARHRSLRGCGADAQERCCQARS